MGKPRFGAGETLLGKVRKLNVPGILLGDIALFIFFSLVTDRFLTAYNLMLILRNTCTLLLTATGLTLVILMGKNDISVGSVVSMSAVSVALLYNAGVPLVLVVLLPLLMGAAIGAFNGFLVAKLKFDYWVVSFASMSIFAGLALVATNGITVSIKSDILDYIGNGKIAGLYVIIWLVILLVGFMIWVQKKTKFGYDVYSIGGSENVAAVSGVKVVKTRILVYTISGLFAALAGLAVACMTNSGSPSVGVDYSFNAMAAVVIGGTSFSGGKGGITGTVLGTLLLRILASGLSLMGIEATWQKAIIGLVIVSLIVVDVLNEQRKNIKGIRRVYNHVA
ncbi:MAG: ABC transporter permease [Faecousia sp.]